MLPALGARPLGAMPVSPGLVGLEAVIAAGGGGAAGACARY